MKKTLLKKLVASALGMTLVMSMGSAAFAAELSSGVAVTDETSVNICKTIKVTNPDLEYVDGPGVSYSYSIASAVPSQDNGGSEVTDSENRTGTVHEGPEEGVTLTVSDVSFPVGTQLNASSGGADNKKYITASTDLTKFTSPGIYRYKISETPSPLDLSSAGVTDTGDRDRYLDVYIENGTSGLEVAGYTIHDKYNNKTDGFNGGTEGSGQAFTGAAQFDTKNIVLETEVSGNMGDKNNQFPFDGLIKDNGRSFYSRKGEAPQSVSSDMAQGSASGTSLSTTLGYGEKYYISGLSSAALVDFTETNNTPDTYSVSITGGTPSEPSSVIPGGKKIMGETSVNDCETVKFINRLDAVSPTGIALRYGYAAFLIAAGGALVLLRRKDRKDNI